MDQTCEVCGDGDVHCFPVRDGSPACKPVGCCVACIESASKTAGVVGASLHPMAMVFDTDEEEWLDLARSDAERVYAVVSARVAKRAT